MIHKTGKEPAIVANTITAGSFFLSKHIYSVIINIFTKGVIGIYDKISSIVWSNYMLAFILIFGGLLTFKS